MRTKVCRLLLVLELAIAAEGTAFGGVADGRVRELIAPVRVIDRHGAADSEILLGQRFGQTCEGRFFVGSGPMLRPDDWLLLDFGRELHGSLQVGSGTKTVSPAKLHVRFGESVSEALAPLGDRGACNDHAIRDDVISLPKMGRREIGETGFRFVWLKNVGAGEIQIEYVRAVSLMRAMKRPGAFRCSDERLNRIFETAVRTAHLCCQDYLWDGIKRDRLVWMGDMHPETMTLLAVFGATPIVPETLDYAAKTTPVGTWMNGMPTYTLWWIRNLAEWYRYTGSLAAIRPYADYLDKTFDCVLAGLDEKGLWAVDPFLDWPTRNNKVAETAGTQGLALLAARDTAFLARHLWMPELERKAAGMCDILQKAHLDPAGEKSAAALLALSGLRDPKEMFASTLSRNGHAGVSTFFGYYVLEAMSAAEENGRALDTVRDYWGAMLDVGATSFWEDFSLAWTNNCFRIDELPVAGKSDIHGDFGAFCYKGFRHSLCHGWSSGPAAWCISHVLGIRPAGVGCRKIEVRPFLGDLDWAEGAMALPDGDRIWVRVEKSVPQGVVVKVDAPKDVEVIKQEKERNER